MLSELARRVSNRFGEEFILGSRMRNTLKRALPDATVRPLSIKAKKILVLAPHPDDELYGCGFLLNKIKGCADVDIIFATCGESYKVQEGSRKDEALSSAVNLKATAHFWGFTDGTLMSNVDELSVTLSKIIAEKTPDLILFPSFNENHVDHRAMFWAAISAVESLELQLNCLMYNTFSPIYMLPSTGIVYIQGSCKKLFDGLESYGASTRREAIETFVLLRRMLASYYLDSDCFWEPYLAFDSKNARQVVAEARGYPEIYPILTRPRHWSRFSRQLQDLATRRNTQ